MSVHYVIIGNGAAGTSAATRIAELDSSAQITIVADETHPAYFRPLIPFLIEGSHSPDNLLRAPLASTVTSSGSAVALQPSTQAVELADGRRLPYDRLLLATGASPYLPPISGLASADPFVLRRWDDAEAIRRVCRPGGSALVLGAGRVGVKCALALRPLGLQVTVIEALSRLIPLQLDDEASAIVQRAVVAQGIAVALSCTVTRAVRERDNSRTLVLEDGRRFTADLLVVAAGVRPNAQLALAAGIQVRSGIVVDDYLRTSIPNVYAAGDVVEAVDVLTGRSIPGGNWTQAVAMGQCAAANMVGGSVEYPGALAVLNALDLAGLPVISVGIVEPRGDDYAVAVSRAGGAYRKLVFRQERLVGALLVGNVDCAGVYTAMIRNRTDASHLAPRMLDPDFGYGRFLHLKTPEPVACI